MGKLIRLPIRRPGPERAPSAELVNDEIIGDRDLVPVAVILWVASVARGALAFQGSEEFNSEATLALGSVFLVPWLCLISYRNERS
jgi:hypothetical protein